jgi:hypothetical protein
MILIQSFIPACLWLISYLGAVQPGFAHQIHLTEEKNATWKEKYGGQWDQPYSGPLSFSHLPYSRCLENENDHFDVAILGMPFDTAVTYRPGSALFYTWSQFVGPYRFTTGRVLVLLPFGLEVVVRDQLLDIPLLGEAIHIYP